MAAFSAIRHFTRRQPNRLHAAAPARRVLILSEIIVKRQHNLVRVAALVHKKMLTRKIYFLTWNDLE